MTVPEMTHLTNSILLEFEEGKEEIVVQSTALIDLNDDVTYTDVAACQYPAVFHDDHENNDLTFGFIQ